tara:strand:- start:76 stop:600 length:525 start_codon:yes stop_codon:yes gene_type:complete
MSDTFDERELKTSFNRYYDFYRMKRSPKNQENWTRFTLQKQNIDTIQKHGTSIIGSDFNIKPFPYNFYFLYRIIWLFMKLWKWIKKADTKAQKFVKSGFVIIIVYVLGLITKCDFFNLNNKTLKETQETTDINHKLKYFQTFSDSLLTETKQKEAKLKEYEQAQKDSTLMNDND